uniref:hypothetical protein n=1 Tax=Pedobacter sp. BG31 TaxID=3349697 RepID=UPI0035F4909A
MQNGEAFYAYLWKVGKKEISVGVALEEIDRGNIYYVLGHIDRNSQIECEPKQFEEQRLERCQRELI